MVFKYTNNEDLSKIFSAVLNTIINMFSSFIVGISIFTVEEYDEENQIVAKKYIPNITAPKKKEQT